jgi:hypothetical protein
LPSFEGDDDGSGFGLQGKSPTGSGVVGDGPAYAGVVATSLTGSGVSAFSDSGAGVLSLSNSGAGVSGQSVANFGVTGRSDAAAGVMGSSGTGVGVAGESAGDSGVSGATDAAGRAGVFGRSKAVEGGRGVVGLSGGSGGMGVSGETASDDDRGIGVYGASPVGRGVVGVSTRHTGVEGATTSGIAVFGGVTKDVHDEPGEGRGVVGVSYAATGVEGNSTRGAGIWGASEGGEGVHGETRALDRSAVAAIQLDRGSTAAAIYGEHKGDGPAAFFKGNVVVTGELEFTGADCAEQFDVAMPHPAANALEPGTVMIIESESAVRPSTHAYDTRVAGVVSGAGTHRPGIMLDKQESADGRPAIALLGKVFCKVDADYAAIGVGDLLTTSPTVGHAMKATDTRRAFGCVVGKALRPLAHGQDLVPILIALQ